MKHPVNVHLECLFWTPTVLASILIGFFAMLCSVGAVIFSNLITIITGRTYEQAIPRAEWIDYSALKDVPMWYNHLTYGSVNWLFWLRELLLDLFTFPPEKDE